MLRQAYVLVHPFDSPGYAQQEGFPEAITSILKGQSDLVILTSDPETTKRKIGERNARIVQTPESDPTPNQGWKRFSQSLRGYQEIRFGGAELNCSGFEEPNGGCVFTAFRRTKVKRKSIDIASCFLTWF